MGFTRHWARPQVLNLERFAQWSADVAALISYVTDEHRDHPLKLAVGTTNQPPIITPVLVWFNGRSPEESGEQFFLGQELILPYASFHHDERGYYGFCKTTRHPYDLLVSAALIRFKHHFGGEVRVWADGGPTEREWLAGIALCTLLFGEAQVPYSPFDAAMLPMALTELSDEAQRTYWKSFCQLIEILQHTLQWQGDTAIFRQAIYEMACEDAKRHGHTYIIEAAWNILVNHESMIPRIREKLSQREAGGRGNI